MKIPQKKTNSILYKKKIEENNNMNRIEDYKTNSIIIIEGNINSQNSGKKHIYEKDNIKDSKVQLYEQENVIKPGNINQKESKILYEIYDKKINQEIKHLKL